MRKEDFFVPMDAEQVNGVWHVGNLSPKFDWKLLDSLWYPMRCRIKRASGSRLLFVPLCIAFTRQQQNSGNRNNGWSIPGMYGYGIRGKDGIILTIYPGMMSDKEAENRKEELSKHEFLKGDLNNLMQIIRKAGLEGYIVQILDTSGNVLKRWDGRKIDMLFVDGSHTYKDVKIDCLWMQHVRKGGVAVFDDWMEPVERAVREYVVIHPEWELLTSSTAQPPGHTWKTVFWRK